MPPRDFASGRNPCGGNYQISYEYTLYAHLISFSRDVVLLWNGYSTDNVAKCVKLWLRVNLRILATRLVGACLTFLLTFVFFYCR